VKRSSGSSTRFPIKVTLLDIRFSPQLCPVTDYADS
jgi:hypothetical protein